MKKLSLFSLLIIFSLVANLSIGFIEQTKGWSNGGYSSDSLNPDYGTHDWIAQHTLDFLPISEKQFILDNLADYLYGTELPDNDKALDRINDKDKHHVYFYANGSLQDDAAAIRAQEEYDEALYYYERENFSLAAKHLGIMSHYIIDQAVFAHVMGVVTEWGAEVKENHSDYEEKVNTRTNNYTDTFNTFLSFDNDLKITSAYDAALMLAYDSTFDPNGTQSCVWMDNNYNWSDPVIQNRAGEALNLAVNMLADVLHTFSTTRAIPEFSSILTWILFLTTATTVVVVTNNRIKKRKY